eukprot:363815-Hanusia_phi.AAC.1
MVVGSGLSRTVSSDPDQRDAVNAVHPSEGWRGEAPGVGSLSRSQSFEDMCSQYVDLQDSIARFELEISYLRSRLGQVERLSDGLPMDYVLLVQEFEGFREDLSRREGMLVQGLEELELEKQCLTTQKAELRRQLSSEQGCPPDCIIVSRTVPDQVEMVSVQVSEIVGDLACFKSKCIARLSSIASVSKVSSSSEIAQVLQQSSLALDLPSDPPPSTLIDALSAPGCSTPDQPKAGSRFRLAAPPASITQRSAAEEFQATLSSVQEGSPTSLKFVEEALREYPRVVLQASQAPESLEKQEARVAAPVGGASGTLRRVACVCLFFVVVLVLLGCFQSRSSRSFLHHPPARLLPPPGATRTEALEATCEDKRRVIDELAACLDRERNSHVITAELRNRTAELHEALQMCRDDMATARVCENRCELKLLEEAEVKRAEDRQFVSVRHKLARKLTVWSRFM